MHTLNAANIFVMLIAAGVTLYAIYRGIMWLASRAIDAIGSMTRFED